MSPISQMPPLYQPYTITSIQLVGERPQSIEFKPLSSYQHSQDISNQTVKERRQIAEIQTAPSYQNLRAMAFLAARKHQQSAGGYIDIQREKLLGSECLWDAHQSNSSLVRGRSGHLSTEYAHDIQVGEDFFSVFTHGLHYALEQLFNTYDLTYFLWASSEDLVRGEYLLMKEWHLSYAPLLEGFNAKPEYSTLSKSSSKGMPHRKRKTPQLVPGVKKRDTTDDLGDAEPGEDSAPLPVSSEKEIKRAVGSKMGMVVEGLEQALDTVGSFVEGQDRTEIVSDLEVEQLRRIRNYSAISGRLLSQYEGSMQEVVVRPSNWRDSDEIMGYIWNNVEHFQVLSMDCVSVSRKDADLLAEEGFQIDEVDYVGILNSKEEWAKYSAQLDQYFDE